MMKLLEESDLLRARELEKLLPPDGFFFGAPAADRAAWNGLDKTVSDGILSQAAQLLEEDEVTIPDEVALRYTTIGDRQVCDEYYVRAARRVRVFALAAAIENGGRFAAAYEKSVRAKCAHKTWVGTAHDRNMDNYYGRDVTIDLNSACFSWELALADRILGGLVRPETRRLVKENLIRRTFEPFEAMIDGPKEAAWWLNTTNNWNAVCLGAVLGAGMAALEDAHKRALYAAAWEKWIQRFQAGFPQDGYCTEGPAYWAYGFSHYLYAAELLRQATGGRADHLRDEKMLKAARFCLRMELPGGAFPAIADCTIGFVPQPRPMNYVCRRLGLAPYAPDTESSPLYADLLFWFDRLEDTQPFRLESARVDEAFSLRTWFDSVGVLLCRPGDGRERSLAACLKGGSNREHHNHNDVGSFVVSKAGVQIVCDIGHEYYSALTFSDKRYESPFYSSYGHGVPRPAGLLQGPAMDSHPPQDRFASRILETAFTEREDRYALDLTDVYHSSLVRNLTRTFTYLRAGEPTLTVEDRAEFDGPQAFETAVMTYGDCQIREREKEIILTHAGQEVRVRVESSAPFTIETERLEGDIKYADNPLYQGRTPTRVCVRLRGAAETCRVRMIFS